VSRYSPLQSFLTANPQPSVVLSYQEIEELIGRRLPNTAYGSAKRQWWANTETHSQALAWLRAGRRAKLDVERDRVTFIRDGDSRTIRTPAAESVLAGLEPAAERMLQDVAEETGTSVELAAAELLNQMARRRRQATLDWFAGKSAFSEVSSAELVREDRDAR
jgi:hypothetical protein